MLYLNKKPKEFYYNAIEAATEYINNNIDILMNKELSMEYLTRDIMKAGELPEPKTFLDVQFKNIRTIWIKDINTSAREHDYQFQLVLDKRSERKGGSVFFVRDYITTVRKAIKKENHMAIYLHTKNRKLFEEMDGPLTPKLTIDVIKAYIEHKDSGRKLLNLLELK